MNTPAPDHGTMKSYNSGCRCEECMDSMRSYARRRKFLGSESMKWMKDNRPGVFAGFERRFDKREKMRAAGVLPAKLAVGDEVIWDDERMAQALGTGTITQKKDGKVHVRWNHPDAPMKGWISLDKIRPVEAR